MTRVATQRRVRSVFISDLHLGYKGADIAAVVSFLRAHSFERLYLVGDILDGWKLENRWYWNRDYTELLDLLVELRQRGVHITLLTGNHDEKLRDILAKLFRPVLLRRFGIRVEERAVHTTRDGKRYLVMHGDQFDGALLRSTSKLADRAWSWLGEKALVRPRPAVVREGGVARRWSLGKAIAGNALALVARYNASALRRATEDGADGIICGHSHVAGILRRRGRVVANCGSWTSARGPGARHSAIVEQPCGTLEMVSWPAMRPEPGAARLRCLAPRAAGARAPDTARLIKLIHALWMPAHKLPQDVAEESPAGLSECPSGLALRRT